jgi:hypothetical protein
MNKDQEFLASGGVPWVPGLKIEMRNSNGDIDATSAGYQYTIQTTSQIRGRVIEQKFYEVPIADYVSVVPGTGAWMEEIKTNQVFSLSSEFESGIMASLANDAQIGNVEVGTSPKSTRVVSWAKGYQYSIPEIEKALASNNWDVVSGKMSALKKNWDLGLQKVAFLGLKAYSDVDGLLTNSEVTADTTTLTENLSAMSAASFATFVANVLGVYSANANYTALPNTFVIPMSDYLGLATPISSGYPVVSKLTYLEDAFKRMCGAGFKILPLAYGQTARNAGYVSAGGTNRYVLYNNNPDTLVMDLPVDFNLRPAGTSNNWQFQGVGVGQFTGVTVFRPREVMYFDHA